MTSNVVVFVRGGTYNLTAEVKLIASDAGRNGFRVIWRNYYGETPVLSGGTGITSFSPSAQPGVYQASVASSVFGNGRLVLYWNGQMLQPARYPNAVTPNFGATDPWADSYLKTSAASTLVSKNVTFTPGLIDTTGWNYDNAQIVIWTGYNYWAGYGNVTTVNSASGNVTVAAWSWQASYNLTVGNRFYIQGIRAALDVPGEWYYDKAAQILYVYPPTPYQAGDRASVSSTVDAFNIDASSNIELRGFTVKEFRNQGIRIYNSGNVTVANSDVSLIGFNDNQNPGAPSVYGYGIYAYSDASGDQGFENILIANNTVHDMAGAGIDVSSGTATYTPGINRAGDTYHFKNLVPSNVRIFNNTLYRTSQVANSYAAISFRLVGGLIANNTIHDLPRTAVSGQGNDNIIEWNHVYDLNRETQDSGGLNIIARSWLYRNNTFRHNFVHDLGGYEYNSTSNSYRYPGFTWGIYPDDYSSETEIHDNIVARAGNGMVQIHAGRDNYVHDNIGSQGMYKGMYAQGEWSAAANVSYQGMWSELQSMTSWGFDTAKYYLRYPLLANAPNPATMTNTTVYDNNRFERNIIYYPDYPSANAYWVRWVFGTANNRFTKNLLWSGGGSIFIQDPEAGYHGGSGGKYAWAQWLLLGFDTDSVISDPLFVNPAADDYTLQGGSPAWALGMHNVIVPR